MDRIELKKYIDVSLSTLLKSDNILFERDISERCLTARWMHHLQLLIPDWHVDVEFNREGVLQDPKRLNLDEICANRRNKDGKAYVVPDLIIHQRGPDGQNLFVAEVKKTTNTTKRDCDKKRVEAFMREFNYQFGAIIEFETNLGITPSYTMTWYST